MKPTQITELFANIRKTFVSFFSILMFVALGVGVFLGINWSSPALQAAAEGAFDEGSMHHVQVTYPYGLTESDVEQLGKVDGVTDVEAGRLAFARLDADGQEATFKLQTLGEHIDVPQVVEGALPVREGEIALNATSAEKLEIKVGDTVMFVHDAQDGGSATSEANAAAAYAAADDDDSEDADAEAAEAAEANETADTADAADDGMQQLTRDTYTVTALVESPEYLAISAATFGYSNIGTGSVDVLGWLPASAFDDDAYQHGYTTVNVRSDALSGHGTFTDAYGQASVELEERITSLGGTLAAQRYESLHADAEEKIADGEAQLADAKSKIAEGEQAIVSGKEQLEEARVTLDQAVAEGEARLASAYQQLLAGEDLKAWAQTQLADASEKLATAKDLLAFADEGVAAVSAEAKAAEQFAADQKKTYDAEKALFDEQTAKHDAGEITDEEYAAAQKRYEQAKAAYDKALDDYAASVTARLQPYADQAGVELPVVTHENFEEAVSAANEIVQKYEDIEITYEGQTMTVREARAKLVELEALLASKQAEFDAKVVELQAGWSQYYAGLQTLAEKRAAGEKQISEGAAKIAEVEQQVEDGKALVAEKEPQLEEAKHKLASMTEYDWTVAGRAYNGGEIQVSTLSRMMSRLSLSMAALFVIVGLLVSYSAVSRIVHEQITQIGTKKALGLRSREITLSFLAYSGIAVLVGSIAGIAMGIVVVEGIIGHTLGGRFVFGDYAPYFDLPLALGVTALELVLILGTTWLACRKILREHAVELLRGSKPPEARTRFYEKWPSWEKLPLLTQTIVNNCVNDKRRVFSTIVGVAGCTALVVTAVTLNDDVLASYDAQYDDVYGYNAIAHVDDSVDGTAEKVAEALGAEGATSAQANRRSFSVTQPDGTRGAMRAFVPVDSDAFEQFYHVNVVEGAQFDPNGEGVWVSQAYASHLGAKVGDELVLDAADGTTHRFTIAGFYEFYLAHNELVMGKAEYVRAFGAQPKANVLLANTQDRPVDEVSDAVADVDGLVAVSDDREAQRSVFSAFSSVSRTVVLIYLALAVLMAIVVLLNLNVMFINEKKRELIVLMINGFSVHDAKRYIYNDTIVLTVVGIVVGLVLGCAMGAVTVGSVEPETATFIKGIAWRAIAAGTLVSAVLSFAMSFIALRSIPRFNLTDINKF